MYNLLLKLWHFITAIFSRSPWTAMQRKKTFDNLKFVEKRHHDGLPRATARLKLSRSIEASVITGDGAYGEYMKEYEIAVFHNHKMLPLSVYDDVLGYLTSAQITQELLKFQGSLARTTINQLIAAKAYETTY